MLRKPCVIACVCMCVLLLAMHCSGMCGLFLGRSFWSFVLLVDGRSHDTL